MSNIRCLLISAIILIISCTNKNTVHIISRNFESEIEMQQNLVFTFDRDLVPDSLIDKWDTTGYIIFTPSVAGQFKWNTKRELMFSPAKSFSPSTEYNSVVTNKIVNFSQDLNPAQDLHFNFHTPFLTLNSASSYWKNSAIVTDAASLVMTLNFNSFPDISSVESHVHLMLNEKPVSFVIVKGNNDENISLLIDSINKSQINNTSIKIIVDKGLKVMNGNYVTKESSEISQLLPAPEKLEIFHAEGEYSGSEAMIHVYTNQSVSEAEVSRLITFDPVIKFNIENVNDGFYIKASFTEGMSYQFTIQKELKGSLGGKMENEFTKLIAFGELEPVIEFTSGQATYLSSKSAKNIALNIVNTPKVRVVIRKIYENNILHFFRNNRSNNYEYDEYEDEEAPSAGYNYNDYNFDLYGDVVFERTYETKSLPSLKGSRLLNISVDEENRYKGIYLVSVSSPSSYYQQTLKLISVSDIGLIAKKTNNKFYVFANSIKTATKQSGVTVSFISSNNQTVYTATTNSDGVAVFDNKNLADGLFNVSMITAKFNNDFNYLVLDETRVNDSRFDVGGRHPDPSGYLTYLYGDRNIYRPGETINLNAIVRTEKWNTLSGVPVKIKLVQPDGREYKTVRGMLDNEGSCATSFTTRASVITGTYVAEVLSANDVLLQSRDISVEEFIPDRIDVKLNLNKPDYNTGDLVIANMKATNLFGPPAAGRKYEAEMSLESKSFFSKEFDDYNFAISGGKKNNFPDVLHEGRTDANGEAREYFAIDNSYKNIGALEGKIFTTVFDETGRPVNRLMHFDYFTQKVFFGILLTDYYAGANSSLSIPIVAVDKNGKAISADARIQVVRNEWYNLVEKSNSGNYHYVSHKRERIISDQVIKINNAGYKLNYTPRESGEFEVRVSLPGSDHFVSSSFYSYGYGLTQNSSFSVNTEGQIDIKADKKIYNPGENAEILFTCPFGGKLLVTAECDDVLKYYYLDTDKKTAKLSFPLTKDYIPNIYITATLFRPLDDGAIPLTVAHGFSSISVNAKENSLPVAIFSADESRSMVTQHIRIKTIPAKDVEVTVAVVDEGILQLKNFKTPDPFNFFYQKKALSVSSHDLYNRLLPDLKLRISSTGGDGYAADMEKRVNPMTNNRVKLVSFWSGILHSNSSGEIDYPVYIPQFSGDLRVMACVYHGRSFGSAEKHIKVADPIVISSGIPRFLSPRDTLIMPVTLSNTTSKQSEVSVSVNATGGLIVNGSSNASVYINAKSDGKAEFRIIAGNSIGAGKISVIAKAMGETFSETTDITIRPSAGLQKISDNGIIEGNTTKIISLKNNFIPATASSRLIISKNPMVQFTNQLTYLLEYPYGCLEQTVSSAFPQLYFSDLVKNVKNARATNFNPQYFVQQAIDKITSMQIYNGSFSYWPGGQYENWWSSIYATHFLIEAKKAGYDINETTLRRSVDYISAALKGHQTEQYYYFDDANVFHAKTIAKKENIYSLYLLSLFDKPDFSSLNYYKSNLNLLALDSRYLLASAFLASGDRKSYDLILPASFSGEHSKRSSGGSFYSYIRDEGIALNALLENDPENIQVGTMVKHLSQQIEKNIYLNTQERSFAFLALGKFLRKQSTVNIKAEISVDGTRIADFTGEDVIIKKGINSKDISVRTSGSGNIYYFLETEGIDQNGNYKESDNFLHADKKFYSRTGEPVSVSQIKQGDLIVVGLSLVCLEHSKVENVVLTDILPAGFEIENPRIGEVKELSWIKNESTPDYFDVRDDRISFFTTAEAEARHFYYLVRAVSPGNYTMGPVGADAMYNGEYNSYHGGGTVKITQ